MAEKKQKTVQIKEIAEKLGVSAGTVSIVLNGRGDSMRISKETQKRVRDMAKELNYQPNIYARRLRAADAGVAARVIAVFWNSAYSDTMMGKFFRGLHQYQKEHNFRMEFYVQIFENGELSKKENVLTPLRFSAVLLCGLSDEDAAFLNSRSFELPVIVLFRSEKNYHCIYSDDYAIGRSVARLLTGHGHKKIAMIGSSKKGRSSMMRTMGFQEGCQENGIEVRPQWNIEKKERNCEAGYLAMQEILAQEEHPSAIFVSANEQVFGIMIACREAGVQIPEDLELLAYGDNEAFAYFSPSISAVYLDLEAVAETAAGLLNTILDNSIAMPIGRMLQEQYAFRESCREFEN